MSSYTKHTGEYDVNLSLGQIFAAVGSVTPPADPALIHGNRITTWGDFDRRTDALAATFLAHAVAGDKLAHLMRNGPAYAETTVAGLKARLVHVNVNYRYTGEELFYILDDSDAAVLVLDAEFAPLVATLRPRLPKLKLLLEVGEAFEAAAESGAPLRPQDHCPNDQLFIYTGGTTGAPKGVMWAQADLWVLMGGGAPIGSEPLAGLEPLLGNIAAGAGRQRSMILPPQMHGTGFLTTLSTLARGGCVVTLPSPGFEPLEALAACADHAPDYLAIVGDAFARPLLTALDHGAGSIASLRTILSSGTMWSPEVKAGLLRHNPELLLLDALSSSESLGIGIGMTTAANAGGPARFTAGPETIVVDDSLRPVAVGETGRLARGGLNPLGYWKDAAKSAATFPTIDGKRYSVAGDFARLEADGSITLLGRGSHCINTGGEKVYPEEVEEALKTHPAVDDALVFGVADAKWGQAVTAIVAGSAASASELIAHVRTMLAPYKAPKRVVRVDTVPRAPNGKADYAAARKLADQAA
jgi:fatty-acyl-CoA synthase